MLTVKEAKTATGGHCLGLTNQPPVLVADEPTGNLDSRTSEGVLAIFPELNKECGITTFVVTHDSSVALHAERTIRAHDGVIAGGGPSLVGERLAGEVPPERVAGVS